MSVRSLYREQRERPLLHLVIGAAGTAVLSEDGQYRYQLTRRFEPGGRTIAFIMLNPSTAGAELDDPTIRRCMGFARAWGYSELVVANLFALRATDPRELVRHPDPVGPANDEVLRSLFSGRAHRVVAAWGAHPLARQPGRLLCEQRHLYCLGTTQAGHPRHPLYVSKDQAMVPYKYDS